MQVIADPETGGLATRCLAIDWRLPDTCQVNRCEEKIFAIVCFAKGEIPEDSPHKVCICKKHHEEACQKNQFHYTINY